MPNLNHPKKGSSIKVGPIKDKASIERIRELLVGKPRDLCLFAFGINTAFRASELLSIKVGQVKYLMAGDDFEIKLSKTQSYRRVTVNRVVINTTDKYLKLANLEDGDWLFPSLRNREKALRVDTLSTYVKTWCRESGLRGNYASHTLRKTWGYWQRVENDVPIPILMAAYGHSNQRQTLEYLCIQAEEIADIYMKLEL